MTNILQPTSCTKINNAVSFPSLSFYNQAAVEESFQVKDYSQSEISDVASQKASVV